jgi:hypothetical protein
VNLGGNIDMKAYIIYVVNDYADAIAISLSRASAEEYIKKYKIKGAWIEEITLNKKVTELLT